MKGSIIIKTEFPNEKAAKNAKITLEKETNSKKTGINRNKRFSSNIKVQNKRLIITVDGKDMVALRATANSFLRYLQVIEKL